jgi:hypothetical protein
MAGVDSGRSPGGVAGVLVVVGRNFCIVSHHHASSLLPSIRVVTTGLRELSRGRGQPVPVSPVQHVRGLDSLMTAGCIVFGYQLSMLLRFSAL